MDCKYLIELYFEFFFCQSGHPNRSIQTCHRRRSLFWQFLYRNYKSSSTNRSILVPHIHLYFRNDKGQIMGKNGITLSTTDCLSFTFTNAFSNNTISLLQNKTSFCTFQICPRAPCTNKISATHCPFLRAHIYIFHKSTPLLRFTINFDWSISRWRYHTRFHTFSIFFALKRKRKDTSSILATGRWRVSNDFRTIQIVVFARMRITFSFS